MYIYMHASIKLRSIINMDDDASKKARTKTNKNKNIQKSNNKFKNFNNKSKIIDVQYTLKQISKEHTTFSF